MMQETLECKQCGWTWITKKKNSKCPNCGCTHYKSIDIAF